MERPIGEASPVNWKSIRLELGSTTEFPAGSVSRVYLIRLPLDDHDAVDEEELSRTPRRATVRRHWSTEPDESGFVVRSDEHWSLTCEGKERRLHLHRRPIRLGSHVSVVEPNGAVLPFRIACVR